LSHNLTAGISQTARRLGGHPVGYPFLEDIVSNKKIHFNRIFVLFKMTCAICYEDMDMLDYNDPNESTQTCFKLGCGHSYHTRCIVLFLTNTHYKCPTCNRVKSVDNQLEMKGRCIRLIKDSMKDPQVKEFISEYKEAKNEYSTSLATVKAEVKVVLLEKSKEHKLTEKRTYFLDCKKTLANVMKKYILENSNKHIAAYFSKRTESRGSISLGDSMVFHGGGHGYQGWKMWRLLHPRIYTSIPFLKKESNGHVNNAADNSSDSSSVHSHI